MSLSPDKMSAFHSIALIGLGSNLDHPLVQIQSALRELHETNEIALARVSSFYETAPVGFADQPMFINAVAEITTTLSPHDLLAALQKIEVRHARVKRERNGPRTLDLDILLFNDWMIDEASLVIPHPRMHERAFVLAPLLEIAPEVHIPAVGDAKLFFATLDHKGVRRWCAESNQFTDNLTVETRP